MRTRLTPGKLCELYLMVALAIQGIMPDTSDLAAVRLSRMIASIAANSLLPAGRGPALPYRVSGDKRPVPTVPGDHGNDESADEVTLPSRCVTRLVRRPLLGDRGQPRLLPHRPEARPAGVGRHAGALSPPAHERPLPLSLCRLTC